MTRRMRGTLVLTALLTLVGGCAPRITTRSLLSDMTSLDKLAEFPAPPYTTRQFSSYDREATSAQAPETWFANSDWGKFLRTEQIDGRAEHVLMDACGPGAIVRIWSANPRGTLRIYLDFDSDPVIAAPMEELLGGKHPGLPSPIAGTRSRGWNLYFPIPYAKHCKITCDDPRFYYHVNYRTYPPNTSVRTFRTKDLKQLDQQVTHLAEALQHPDQLATPPVSTDPDAPRPTARQRLAPRESLTVDVGSGRPEAIVELRAAVTAANADAALRSLLLTLEFDGHTTVACPLGDFFGAGPHVNPYTSLPMGITPDGEFWSHWVMPYQQSARVMLTNLGDAPADLCLDVLTAPYRWTRRTLYFHAGWRIARDVPTRPFRDWNYVELTGRGVFVGAAFSVANPVKTWWGEGDEKIYVDGETFPSHFGTGTEDYYGYAWCCNEPFTHAYHAQPRCDGPNNYGRTAINRWHVLDRIPFTQSFRFDMELWHWHETTHLPEMSVMTYWYAPPDAQSNLRAPQADDLRLVTLPPYVPPRVAGALEGELLQVQSAPGTAGPQAIDGCSNDAHLWWREAQPGDRLTLTFDVPLAGRYRIHARFVQAVDYGVVSLYVNDVPLTAALDLFNSRVIVSDERPLGEVDLPIGPGTFVVEIVGHNEQAVPGYMFGLDYLRLEPVPTGAP